MRRALQQLFDSLSNTGSWKPFPVLSSIDRELRSSLSLRAAAEVIRKAKPHLCARLLVRFGSPAAEALTVKILNLLFAQYQFKARSLALLSRPIGLVVDPSNVCRLSCPGCVHSSRNQALGLFDWPKGTLSEDRFAALLRQYGAYALGTNFYSYGEPLLNLGTPKLIRCAKSYLMTTTISTSLSVQRFDAEAYVESGLDLMILSVDGATQQVYERFRRGGNLELVLENIKKLVCAKKALGRRTPMLCWKFLRLSIIMHMRSPWPRSWPASWDSTNFGSRSLGMSSGTIQASGLRRR